MKLIVWFLNDELQSQKNNNLWLEHRRWQLCSMVVPGLLIDSQPLNFKIRLCMGMNADASIGRTKLLNCLEKNEFEFVFFFPSPHVSRLWGWKMSFVSNRGQLTDYYFSIWEHCNSTSPSKLDSLLFTEHLLFTSLLLFTDGMCMHNGCYEGM